MHPWWSLRSLPRRSLCFSTTRPSTEPFFLALKLLVFAVCPGQLWTFFFFITQHEKRFQELVVKSAYIVILQFINRLKFFDNFKFNTINKCSHPLARSEECPCRISTKFLQENSRKFPAKNLEIIGQNTDTSLNSRRHSANANVIFFCHFKSSKLSK